MPGPVLGTQLVGAQSLPGGDRDPHFTDEETEAQGMAVSCSRSSSLSGRILPMGVWVRYLKEALEWRHEEKLRGWAFPSSTKPTRHQKRA